MRWDLYQGLINWIKKPKTLLYAKDESENEVSLSAVKDDEGKAILRTIDAAPYAYNPQRDTLRIESASRESLVETLADEVIIGANSAQNIGPVVYDGESRIFIAIAVDVDLWSLSVNNGYPWGGEYSTRYGLYPLADSVTDTFGMNTPFVCMPVIAGFWDKDSMVGTVNNFSDAQAIALKGNFGLRFFNESGEDAKVTIKIYRIYD